MNYYQFSIGDFNKDTRHLTIVERALYRELLDMYYATEKPIPAADFDWLAKRVCAKTDEEKALLRDVLREFFTLENDLYYNTRCDAEILIYKEKIAKASRAGKASALSKAKQKGNKRSTRVEQVFDSSSTPTTHYPLPTMEVTTFPQKHLPSQKPATDPRNIKTWEAYAAAYVTRYRAPPVRNAKVNGNIAQLVKRLGDESPEVAAFYVTHNEQFYVKKRHPVSLLLSDAEGLRTQWKTGKRATGLEARSAERMDSVAEQLKRLKENHDA